MKEGFSGHIHFSTTCVSNSNNFLMLIQGFNFNIIFQAIGVLIGLS